MAAPEIQAAALKAVHTFGAIMKCPLVLKDGKEAGTEGFTVTAPFRDKDFYLLVERQLAHLLFRSDPKAKALFVDEFKQKTLEVARKVGLPAKYFENIEIVLSQIVDVLESRRIESLWRLLYPGSYMFGRKRLAKFTEKYVGYAHLNFFDLFVCLDAGHEIPPGLNDRFKPMFMTALEKVERRGFGATLISARWLISQLVNDIIKESETAEGEMGQESALKLRSAKDRLNAISSMTQSFGQLGPSVKQHYSDYSPTVNHKGEQAFFKNRISDIDAALKLDLKNEAAVMDALGKSEQQMAELLEEVQQALGKPLTKEEATQRRFRSKIIFRDVSKKDFHHRSKPRLSDEDVQAVRKLRFLFLRTMNRQRTFFTEGGADIDVARYIERRAEKNDLPIFKQQLRGQGFKSMLLLDRSISMHGPRTDQTRRAALILNSAMTMPSVDLKLWGFQGYEDGEVTLTRFARDVPSFEPPAFPVGGDTPLHIAIRAAVREFEGGSEMKQLVVITDGAPYFAEEDSKAISRTRLLEAVREAVRDGRRKGVNITALLIGTPDKESGQILFDVAPEHVTFMFGPPRYWRFVDEGSFSSEIVKAVTEGFQAYLRSR
jgi:Mg-chelatase subunit ChlD